MNLSNCILRVVYLPGIICPCKCQGKVLFIQIEVSCQRLRNCVVLIKSVRCCGEDVLDLPHSFLMLLFIINVPN